MDIRNIVKSWLKENRYSGLFYQGECACSIEDLMPCGNPCPDCEIGYVVAIIEDNGEEGFRVQRTKSQTIKRGRTMSDIKHDPIANACYHFAIQLGITDTEKRENFINWASKQAAEINELKNELAFQIRRNEVNESALSEKIKEVLRLTARVAELEKDTDLGEYVTGLYWENEALKADNVRMREALEKLVSDCKCGDFLFVEYIRELVEKALKGGE